MPNRKPDYSAWYLNDRATGDQYYYLQRPDSVIRVNLTRLYINEAKAEHLAYGIEDPSQLEPVTLARYRQIIRTLYLRAIQAEVNAWWTRLLQRLLRHDHR